MYINVPVPKETIAEDILHNTPRTRSQSDVRVLHSLQDEDKAQNRDICRHHSIMLLTAPHVSLFDKVGNVQHLLKDTRDHAKNKKLAQGLGVARQHHDIITPWAKVLKRVLVLDVDKILSSLDAAPDGKTQPQPLEASFSLFRSRDTQTTLSARPPGYTKEIQGQTSNAFASVLPVDCKYFRLLNVFCDKPKDEEMFAHWS